MERGAERDTERHREIDRERVCFSSASTFADISMGWKGRRWGGDNLQGVRLQLSHLDTVLLVW